jgi:cyclic pyranopterin phosphate synthase
MEKRASASSSPVNYLRLSITDRCNLRCFYCTYWQDWEKLASSEILSYEELLRVANIATRLGIRKIRLTGGEPLMRRDLAEFIRNLIHLQGIEEICLTTNGTLLCHQAPALYEAGLRRLNVSLDTLTPARYVKITGGDKLAMVLAGLERALDLGFQSVKINCVALAGINDDELLDLALLARDRPFQVRFIELMPTASPGEWQTHFLPISAVRRRLAPLGELAEVAPSATAGPARIFRVRGFQGELGFISPMSDHQCTSCNRLRLTAQGRLRPCLLADHDLDLKAPLRMGLGDDSLSNLFEQALELKGGRTGFPLIHPHHPGWSMVSIGG